MKKNNFLILIIIGLVGCSQQRRAGEADKEVGYTPSEIHEVVTSPAFWGVYKGVLPPVEGSAIDIVLTINEDNTYRERLEYIDRDYREEETEEQAEVQIEILEGHYTVEDSILVLFPDRGEKEYYRIENNQLRKLDKNAKPVTGLLEDRFVLERQ